MTKTKQRNDIRKFVNYIVFNFSGKVIVIPWNVKGEIKMVLCCAVLNRID